ncbi:hypothetical protein SAMN04487857_11311 [Pseudomonas sp. ok272]|uniref:lysine methyltransferase n=1 Tax=unclassified Pseudomonas TaxID=196821 RepID=UPI0008C7B711|nr:MULTISPECIES: lysine methyltransferase [unclassified Pseudomonas]SEN28649.1 hypothetical protein SAMN04487857_11311 [Pseudomonas sp. ok272]SFN21053.1 hypothetical protein SAMN04487858_114159 [Pseudomonas sp. ok602]
MKSHPKHPLQAPPGKGIYPSPILSVREGYPSARNFRLVQAQDDAAAAIIARRHALRISRLCRVSGQLTHERQRHTVQLLPGIHMYDPFFCGLLPHSCDPSVFLDMSELWLWSLQDIRPGCALSMDYTTTEDRLLRQFACQCGSPQCRGWITGYDESPNAEGLAYLQRWRRHSLD